MYFNALLLTFNNGFSITQVMWLVDCKVMVKNLPAQILNLLQMFVVRSKFWCVCVCVCV